MKKALLIIGATLLVAMNAWSQSRWAVDNAHSSISFTVPHLVISEVEGRFTSFSGSIDSATSDFSNAKISFSVDVSSLSTGNEMRDRHVKSDDFLNAEKYPHMSFTSASWKKVGDNSYALEGFLTIRDVTRKATFNVIFGGTMKDSRGLMKAGFKASTTINRLDYGVKWSALTEAGGMVVGKDVTISLLLEFSEQKPS